MSPKDIFWNDTRSLLLMQRTSQLVKRLVFQGAKVLDIGCSFGRLYPVVEQAGGEWWGWDRSEDAKTIFIGNGGDPARFVVGNCMKDQHPEAPFHIVLGVMMETALGLSPTGFRDKFIHIVKTPGMIVNMEAAETYIWHRYPPGYDEPSESIRQGLA